VSEKSSIDLEFDPKVMIRSRVIREYGADKGRMQAWARLAEYVAGMKT
jgi:hypothetical protein